MGHSTFLAASGFAGAGSAMPRVDVSQLHTRKGGKRWPSLYLAQVLFWESHLLLCTRFL